MTLINLEEYKQRKKDEESQRQLKNMLMKLDALADYAYENYDRTELKQNSKVIKTLKLIKTLDEKYEKDKE